MMVHCNSYEASMRVKHFCALAATEHMAHIWYQLNAFKPPGG